MIAYKSADQLAKLIKDKEISSVELLDYYISRVEKYNSDINAIVVKDYEKAKKAAAKVSLLTITDFDAKLKLFRKIDER